MSKSKRIADIEKYIYDNKNVTLKNLCETFNVSLNTMRRDIQDITQRTNIKKVYGGVCVMQNKHLIAFEKRFSENTSAKQKIAKKAAELIEDGDIIFIDSGTTTTPMIDYIDEKKHVTVLTNNLKFIYNSIPYENLKIISLSGTLNRDTLSFTGGSAAEILNNFNISKAFMAATGISLTYGITNSSIQESMIKQAAVKRSQQKILLADHSKFDSVSLTTYCQLNCPDIIITDSAPPTEYSDYIKKVGHKLIII